ncbi:hypothetical protein AB1Y20_013653 [Prymnesium parvum]|uniref:Uncharacterized protein n=1 Tax=Prymnesium parvum TaxID=97485 RepID=A0AB34IJ93_PRYPA
MFPVDVAVLTHRARASRTDRAQDSALANLLVDGECKMESASRALPSAAQTTPAGAMLILPIGYEQKLQATTLKLYYVDHMCRMTSWIDPRQQAAAADLPSHESIHRVEEELQLLCSAAVGPEDFRASLDLALRNVFAFFERAEEPKGYCNDSRIHLLQLMHRATAQRLLAGVSATTHADAVASCFLHMPAQASTDVVEREISKLGKHVDKELLDLYTKGFLGPKVPHIERVLLRLDNISTNGLRIQQLRGSSRERSTSPVREACQSLESRLAACFSSPKIDSELRWVVIHTQLAFAEATGMLRPLLSAILAMRVHGQATDGSNETSAPGLSERVQRLEASLRADYEKQLESANFVLMYHPYRCSLKALLEKYWGEAHEMPQRLQAFCATLGVTNLGDSFISGRRPSLSFTMRSSGAPKPALSVDAATAALLVRAAAYAVPVEHALLGRPPPDVATPHAAALQFAAALAAMGEAAVEKDSTLLSFGLAWHQAVQADGETLDALARLTADLLGAAPAALASLSSDRLRALCSILRLLRVHLVALWAHAIPLPPHAAAIATLRLSLLPLLAPAATSPPAASLAGRVCTEAVCVLLAASRSLWPSLAHQRAIAEFHLAAAAAGAAPPPLALALISGLLRLLATRPRVSYLAVPPRRDEGKWGGEGAAEGEAEAAAAEAEVAELVALWGCGAAQAEECARAAAQPEADFFSRLLRAAIGHAHACVAAAALPPPPPSPSPHPPPPPAAAAHGLLLLFVGLLQELAARAAVYEEPLATVRVAAAALLLEAPALLRGEAEAALGGTCVGEPLLFLLDSLALLTVETNAFALALLPPLHALAKAIEELGVRGADAPPAAASLSTGDALESAHPLPAAPPPLRQVVTLPGARHLSVSFDGQCATHDFDVVSVELPAPPLPAEWSLEAELAELADPPPSDQLELQARRAEYKGDASVAYALYLSLFDSGKSLEHLLSAARVALRLMHHPHKACAILQALLADHQQPESNGSDVVADAQALLEEARKAADADIGKRIAFSGPSAKWPRRELIVPGDTCTIVFAPSGISSDDSAGDEYFTQRPKDGLGEPLIVGSLSEQSDDAQMELVEGMSSKGEGASAPDDGMLTIHAERPEHARIQGRVVRRMRAASRPSWHRVMRLMPQILSLARQLKLREESPTWGFKVEVRAWSPASEGHSLLPRLRCSVGGLMARYSAALIAATPLTQDEIKLQRWLSSPLFECHPMNGSLSAAAIATKLLVPPSYPIIGVVQAIAAGAEQPEQLATAEATFIEELCKSSGKANRLHLRMLDMSCTRSVKQHAREEGSHNKQQRVLIAWLLKQRGLLRMCTELQDTNDELSGAMPALRPLKDAWKDALDLHAELEAELKKQYGDSYSPRHIDQLANLLLQAAPAKGGGELRVSKSAETSGTRSPLSQEVLLWVSSRQDLSTLLNCFGYQQQRAIKRAIGFRYMAATLRRFSYSDAIVTFALRVLKQAFRAMSIDGVLPKSGPSHQHYSSNTSRAGNQCSRLLRRAWVRLLDALTAMLESTGDLQEASERVAETLGRKLALQVLHMPLDEHDQKLVVQSPLLRHLQLNAQSAVGMDAVASRLLWVSLAAQCLKPDREMSSADAEVVTTRSAPHQGIIGMIAALSRLGRKSATAGRALHAQAAVGDAAGLLLELLLANLTVVLRWAALHGGAVEVKRGVVESDALMVADDDDATTARMIGEAQAEAVGRGAVAGSSDPAVASEDSVAAQRLEHEKGLLLILGLLFFASTESKAVCASLAEPRWLEQLLAIPHYSSPRNIRVCMRLLARALPATQPATTIVPPPAAAVQLEECVEPGMPLVAFVLDLIGRELTGHGHLLAFGGDHGGKARWRSSLAWQAIVEAAVALLRRLLFAENWRPHLLETLVEAVKRGAAQLLDNTLYTPTAEVRNAIAAFSVLGGHVHSLVPGARVSVRSQAAEKNQSGTVVSAGSTAGDILVVMDAGAQQWRNPMRASIDSLVVRPQVTVQAAMIGQLLPELLEKGYRPFLRLKPEDEAARTPLGSLLYSRALASLQVLCEDSSGVHAVIEANLMPDLIICAVRPIPIDYAISLEPLQRQLLDAELVLRELASARRPPSRLSLSKGQATKLIRRREAYDKASRFDPIVSSATSWASRYFEGRVALSLAPLPRVDDDVPSAPPTQQETRPSAASARPSQLQRSPSWEKAEGLRMMSIAMGFEFSVGLCKRALQQTRGNHDLAISWMLDHPDAKPVPEPELPQHIEAALAAMQAAREAQSEWFITPESLNPPRPRPPPPPPPPPAHPPRTQLLSVTRPVSGPQSFRMRPGQEILVADPHGNRYRCRVPENVVPGQTFHVQVPLPAPPPPAVEEPPAPTAQFGEFLPSTENIWLDTSRSAGDRRSPLHAGKVASPVWRSSPDSSVSAPKGSSSLLAEEVYFGAPLRLGVHDVPPHLCGLVGRVASSDSSGVRLVVRDPNTDALLLYSTSAAALALPEESLCRAVGIGMSAESMTHFCSKAQTALGVLSMRRAMLSVGVVRGEEDGIDDDSANSLAKISSQLDDPRQLMVMLKLALAAGGDGFESLFDGLRPLIQSPPEKLKQLPSMLCKDAITHVRNEGIANVQTAESVHPYVHAQHLPQGATSHLATLQVSGASALRVEVDGRTALPPGIRIIARTSERPPYVFQVLYTPNPTHTGSGGVITVPGDTVYVLLESVPDNTVAMAQKFWGWAVRATGERWAPPPEREVMRAPLPVGWPLLNMILELSPAVLKATEVFTMLYDILRHPNAIGKEYAAAMLLKLLRLAPSREDPRKDWQVEKLVPLYLAVELYAKHKDEAGLLPRHAQLYAEILGALPGSGSCTQACESAEVDSAASLLDWKSRPSALPKEAATLYRKIARIDNFTIALLYGYKQALGGGMGKGPLPSCIRALPPQAACAFAWQHTKVLSKSDIFTPSLDEKLIQLAQIVMKQRELQGLSDVKPEFLNFAHNEEVALKCDSLLSLELSHVRQRWRAILDFNERLQEVFCYVHTGWTAQPHTLGARICALRTLVLWDAKIKIWEAALPKPPPDAGVVHVGTVVSLNRFAAEAAAKWETNAAKKLMFDQLFEQLDRVNPKLIQRTDRGFKVKFVGEASDDYGGPYREALTNICAELQSEDSELLVLCPNGQHGLGLNRSSYTVRPSATSYGQLTKFSFLGKLMGCALLQKQASLDLELCPHFWKQLVSIDLEPSDLAEFDDAEYNSLQRLRYIDVTDGVDAELFGDLFFNTFEVTLSDGTVMELMDNGRSKNVTFHNRHTYCNLAIAARLHEGTTQCHAVLAGLRTVVPSIRLLSLMTGHDLELLTCGEAAIDLQMLKRHTSYGASLPGGANEPHIRLFWQVLEELDAEERRQFLAFSWGRNRLPLTDADWGGNTMKIHTLETPKPNGHFPVAHTCFFSIEWPKYTTREIAKDKLLYAIRNCRAIDADNTAEGRRNMGANAFS